MANLNPRQFRMVTNMKAAPGSQGTLFQGGNPTHYPRNFTPERRDAVRDAMGVTPYMLRGNRGRSSGHNGPGTKPDYASAVATVARSTVPVEDLHDAKYSFGQHLSTTDSYGFYRRAIPGHSNAHFHSNHVVIRQGHAQGTTVIHEIGHHTSAMAGTEHSAYDTPSRRGTEEGFAENYAETHYRDHRGRPTGRSFHTSPEKWSNREGPEGAYGGTYGDVATFNYAFEQEREKSPTAARHRAANAALLAPPKDQVPGQTPLLHRVTSGYPSQQHLATWDYTDEHRAQGMRGPNERPWDRGGRTPEQIRNTELARNAERRSRRNR